MKTYVTIELNDKTIMSFDTIDEAVEYAERLKEYIETDAETLEISVYDTENKMLEYQTSKFNAHSGHFEYCTWGIFGYDIDEESGKCTNCEILESLINSEAEARKIAETIKDKFSRFDRVCIEWYLQSIDENIGDVGASYIIYGENPDE